MLTIPVTEPRGNRFKAGIRKIGVYYRGYKIRKRCGYTVATGKQVMPTFFSKKAENRIFFISPHCHPSIEGLTSPLKFRGKYIDPRGRASRNSFD